MPTKSNAKDWRNRPIADWNCTTFHAFIIDKTAELYGHTYAPGGRGSKAQRWSLEKGMLKRAQQQYGNEVLRQFIEICWSEYRTTKPDQFPYPTFVFMYSWMDRYFDRAVAEVTKEKRREEATDDTEAIEDLSDWI
jgi:hypothetical protein